MSGYAKLFTRILDSTIWREDNETRILWITMLAMADRDGIVHCTIPGLADRARITLEECESALERFQQPDKYSWSQEEEGRRIKVVQGGWFLINHAKYRSLMSLEETREKTRLRVQKHREVHKKIVTDVTSNGSNDIATATTEATATTKAISQKRFVPPSLEEVDSYIQSRSSKVNAIKFWNYYESNGWMVGRNKMKNWHSSIAKWEQDLPAIGGNTHGQVYESSQERRQRKNQEAAVAHLAQDTAE